MYTHAPFIAIPVKIYNMYMSYRFCAVARHALTCLACETCLHVSCYLPCAKALVLYWVQVIFAGSQRELLLHIISRIFPSIWQLMSSGLDSGTPLSLKQHLRGCSPYAASIYSLYEVGHTACNVCVLFLCFPLHSPFQPRDQYQLATGGI